MTEREHHNQVSMDSSSLVKNDNAQEAAATYVRLQDNGGIPALPGATTDSVTTARDVSVQPTQQQYHAPHEPSAPNGSYRNRSEAAALTSTGRRAISTPTGITPIVLAMSSLLRLNLVPETNVSETFRCHVCRDDVRISEAVTLAQCGHKYCRSCITQFLELKINEGKVYPVCFHPVNTGHDGVKEAVSTTSMCGATVTPAQIKQIVDAEVYDKFECLRFVKDVESERESPFCSHSHECAWPDNPTCVCSQSGKSFCFLQGNAHVDGTCAAHVMTGAQGQTRNRAKIDEDSKPCPKCNGDVAKFGGCNHTKCICCNTSFCWTCGEIIEDTPMPSHYLATGGYCSDKQFDRIDGEDEQPHLTIWLCLLITILTITVVPLAFIVSALLTPFMWCCGRSRSLSDVFCAIDESVTVALCKILMLVLTPVGWVVTFCVDFVVVIGMIISDVFGACCCQSERHSSDSFDIEDPSTNSLGTG